MHGLKGYGWRYWQLRLLGSKNSNVVVLRGRPQVLTTSIAMTILTSSFLALTFGQLLFHVFRIVTSCTGQWRVAPVAEPRPGTSARSLSHKG